MSAQHMAQSAHRKAARRRTYVCRRYASCLFTVIGILFGVSGVALAAGKPTIVIPPVLKVPSPSELDFVMRVDDAEGAPPASVLLISGLPADVTFSAGRSVVRGTWEVPLEAIAGLKAKIPAELKGRSDLVILLTHNKDKYTIVLASARSALVVDDAASSEQAAAAPAEPRKGDDGKKAEEERRV